MTETNINNNTIPYVIFDCSTYNGSSIQYGSTTEDNLYNELTDILKDYITNHNFDMLKDYSKDDDDTDDEEDECNTSNKVSDSELTCDECWCCVVSKKYITVTNNKRLCSACNPVNNVLNKKIFTNFTLYLKKSKENCDIIYFKDGKWHDFVVV